MAQLEFETTEKRKKRIPVEIENNELKKLGHSACIVQQKTFLYKTIA